MSNRSLDDIFVLRIVDLDLNCLMWKSIWSEICGFPTKRYIYLERLLTSTDHLLVVLSRQRSHSYWHLVGWRTLVSIILTRIWSNLFLLWVFAAVFATLWSGPKVVFHLGKRLVQKLFPFFDSLLLLVTKAVTSTCVTHIVQCVSINLPLVALYAIFYFLAIVSCQVLIDNLIVQVSLRVIQVVSCMVDLFSHKTRDVLVTWILLVRWPCLRQRWMFHLDCVLDNAVLNPIQLIWVLSLLSAIAEQLITHHTQFSVLLIARQRVTLPCLVRVTIFLRIRSIASYIISVILRLIHSCKKGFLCRYIGVIL